MQIFINIQGIPKIFHLLSKRGVDPGGGDGGAQKGGAVFKGGGLKNMYFMQLKFCSTVCNLFKVVIMNKLFVEGHLYSHPSTFGLRLILYIDFWIFKNQGGSCELRGVNFQGGGLRPHLTL